MTFSERTNCFFVIQSTFTLPSSVLSRTCLAILTLSICLVLQVLGTPVGFIDLLASDSPEESSLSEGFSILAETPVVKRPTDPRFSNEATSTLYRMLLSDLIFRPPQ